MDEISSTAFGFYAWIPLVGTECPIWLSYVHDFFEQSLAGIDVSNMIIPLAFTPNLHSIPGRYRCVRWYDGPRHRVSSACKIRISNPVDPVKGYLGIEMKIRKLNIKIKRKKDPKEINVSKDHKNV